MKFMTNTDAAKWSNLPTFVFFRHISLNNFYYTFCHLIEVYDILMTRQIGAISLSVMAKQHLIFVKFFGWTADYTLGK